MKDRPRLVGISGSIRAGSFCTAILRTAAEQIADDADLNLFPLETIPPYNQDKDNGAPPKPVKALRHALSEAAGLVIVTPEYNHGLPGVLKNALDWASRPYGQSKLTGLHALTISASPAFTGGVRAQAQLNETLLSNAAKLTLRPQIVIGLVHEKVKDGRLVEPTSLQFVVDGLRHLLELCQTNAT